jgi:serine/threonine protein kinase
VGASAGVVHQDIKPQNVLVDEAGCPRLIAFGLARLRHAWSARIDQGPASRPILIRRPTR